MRKRSWNSIHRTAANFAALFFVALAAALVLAPLLAIFGYLIYRGAGALSWSFFTHLPQPVGELGGGMANTIVGSAMILGIASLMGVPVGIGAGIYLSEFARGKARELTRFAADVLNGVPSIIIGLTAYALAVLPEHHFSAFSGGIALAIMMIPIIARTAEEALGLVPSSIREGAKALGILDWKSTLCIVLPAARSGIIAGVMLAFARVAGETAPLLFTAFGNQFWNLNPNQPTAALPLQIFVYAISPYDDWHRQAWAGALVLIALIVVTLFVVRLAAARNPMRGSA